MPLSPGVRLGPYEILDAIGAGGMGEVYRATDARLGRDVALKVMPEAFARDVERMVRFEREAKLLASLNHPNIASIYGLEESNGVRALVMELVEGPTLADRIKQTPIPFDEAMPIAKQIAEALEYAHEHGIIHRDLKPSNVKLTPDSQVKILDFGLAKALEGETAEQELQNSPTLSAVATRTGVLLGTAAYMSPEQARGRRVDRRTDIWAFGCVLYEMLTGKSPFTGETISDTLAAVIRAEPDWNELPRTTSLGIRQLFRRCLEKDPKLRLRDIGEARFAIDEVLSGSPTAEAALGAVPTQLFWRQGRPWALLALGLALGAVGAGLTTWYLRPAPERRAVSRFAFSISFPEGQSPASAGYPLRDFPAVAISPDGSELAYVTGHGETTQIFLRSMDRLEPQPLVGTTNATSPFFSPDGQWVGFFADGKLKKVSIHGGEPVALCDAPVNRSASWGPDNTIIFAPTLFGSLMRVSAAGGSPEALTTLDVSKGELSHRWPEILPGGNAVMYVIAEAKNIGSFSEAKIAIERLDTHEKKILPIQGTYPRYSPSGHLLFAREGRVFAVRFDANRLELNGPPIPVLDGVKSSPNSGAANFMISDTGALVYLAENASVPEGRLVWVDRKNHVQTLAAPGRAYGSLQISPEGQRVAVSIFTGDKMDVWLYEIHHGSLTRITFDEQSTAPIWSPDGKQIAFTTRRGVKPAILSKPADGSGAEETLVSGQSLIQIPTSWSPDGKFLAYWTVGSETGRDISIVPLQGDRKPRPFLQTKFNEQLARFSPDCQWIAYTSDESGRFEVYVQPFPGPGGKWQVSTEGGNQPIWGRNGRELFFLSSNKIMGVSVATQPSFSASIPQMIADIPTRLSASRLGNFSYDVTPDGQRFLFVKANMENGPPDEVRVVLNWIEELKRLAPATKQP